MKLALTYTAGIIGLAIGLIATTVFAQTTANGPYYATPSWDQTLPSSTRFIVLSNMGSAAVLDRETGLVWERSPSTSLFIAWGPENTFGGIDAHEHCYDLYLGNRAGWRLPSLQELESLIDRSQPNPTLPAGHPFTLPPQSQFVGYWSATQYRPTIFGSAHHFVEFAFGNSGASGDTGEKNAWCVRGGSGNPQQ